MKVLFVGIGSIGTRHLRNLHTVAKERGLELDITALRSSDRKLPDDVSRLIDRQIMELDDTFYDLAFITNPTTLHYRAIEALRGKAGFFFIEKPIFEDSKWDPADLGLTRENAYVACPMRYCGAYMKLKEILADKKPFSVRIICSSYLPGWRPNIDYRKNYSAIRALGGGVTIDLIHELDYMTDLFGFPVESYNFKGTYSDLEIDSDDLSVYISRYPDKICEVHLDYFGREYRRTCEVFVSEGTIEAEFGKGSVTLPDGTYINCNEDANMRFIREMRNVLDIMDGKAENINDVIKARKVLALTLGQEV
ncbi:MAG: Gfo/Idh/MocA family oxidoreductase [Oscillospiraceae bacterium]|nr:Gfo/Idh/MocA family oxidoreductase [Oscillospiraceae bacterium]